MAGTGAGGSAAGWAVGIAGGSTGGGLPWMDAGGRAEGAAGNGNHAERSDPTMQECRNGEQPVRRTCRSRVGTQWSNGTQWSTPEA